MKKLIVYFLTIIVSTMVFTACGTSKSGCGLTSDTLKMQPLNTTQNTVLLAKN